MLLAGRDRFVSSYCGTYKAFDFSAVASQGQTEVGEQCVQGQEEKQDSQRYVQKMGGTNMIEVLKQNEAMRLADAIDPLTRKELDNLTCKVAADELRRLHEENQVLRQAIKEWESQEPVTHKKWCASLTQLLMSMPPQPAPCNCQPPQRTEEHNFCSRCGKRTPDAITIHTCTPPQEST